MFLADAPATEIDEWLRRTPDDSQDRRDLNLALLDTVRERGYSLLAAEPEALRRHQAVLTEFEQSDRLTRQERVVRQVTSELGDLFCPDLVPGERYDLAYIVVGVPTPAGQPPMALRMTGLPPSLPAEQIESWIDRLKQVAAAARRP